MARWQSDTLGGIWQRMLTSGLLTRNIVLLRSLLKNFSNFLYRCYSFFFSHSRCDIKFYFYCFASTHLDFSPLFFCSSSEPRTFLNSTYFINFFTHICIVIISHEHARAYNEPLFVVYLFDISCCH